MTLDHLLAAMMLMGWKPYLPDPYTSGLGNTTVTQLLALPGGRGRYLAIIHHSGVSFGARYWPCDQLDDAFMFFRRFTDEPR